MTTTNSSGTIQVTPPSGFFGSDGFYTLPTISATGAQYYTITTDPTPSGTQVGLKLSNDHGKISPSLYIKYVKSKIGKVEMTKVKARVDKLKKLVLNAHDMGQTTLYENLSKMLIILVRESEANAYGIDKFLDKPVIDKFMHKVKENPVKFDLLEKFPRTIPAVVQKKIKKVQKAALFDSYHVLYLDYTKQDTRTNKDKIRDKDPILFGRYDYQPERFYFIADWVDERCDLTLDKFVDSMKKDDKEFQLGAIPELNEKFFDTLKAEVKDRHDRLAGTRRDNYKDLMKIEDAVKGKRSFNLKKKFAWLLGKKD